MDSLVTLDRQGFPADLANELDSRRGVIGQNIAIPPGILATRSSGLLFRAGRNAEIKTDGVLAEINLETVNGNRYAWSGPMFSQKKSPWRPSSKGNSISRHSIRQQINRPA